METQGLQGASAANLQRAERDNDLVYMAPIPPATQLPSIVSAPMVKPTVPQQVEDSLDWVLKQNDGALFSGLVPYGVHVALSESEFDLISQLPWLKPAISGIYDDRKDTLVRQELESKQEELDAIAATYAFSTLPIHSSLTWVITARYSPWDFLAL